MWGYAALIAGLVSGEVPTSQRWYYFLLILLTPPFFLLLTRILPASTPGLIPLTLVVLFLIGASMRRWIVGRLGGPS
jgi:cobalamin synthase